MSSLLFKSLALSVGLFGAAAGVMAATDVTTCPSPEFIQKTVIDNPDVSFTEIDVNPISFDVNTNLFSMLISTINLGNDGAEAFNMANIKGTAEQNWEEIAYQSIATLQSDNATPVVFHIQDDVQGDLAVAVCSYHAANDADIKGTYYTVKPDDASVVLDAAFAKRLQLRLKHGFLPVAQRQAARA